MRTFFRLCRIFKWEVLDIPARVIMWIFIIFLFSVPLFSTNSFLFRILNLTALFAIYAASWDLLGGFVGQVNLGQALFFGVGAYIAGLLNLNFGLQFWATLPIAGLGSVMLGLIAGYPTLRLRGFYFALVTLSFPIILTGIVLALPGFTGGEMGLYGIDGLMKSPILNYYFILIVMLFSTFIMYKFSDVQSKFVRTGVVLSAIRVDEIAARASGINTVEYKLGIFAMSGFFSGIAGAIYAHLLGVAGPSNLELFFSVLVVLWVVFGGIRTIYGAVAGVYLLYPLLQFIRIHPLGDDLQGIILSVMLIVILLFMPEGITVWVRDKIEIECPRCKLLNIMSRQKCRACRAPLHLETEESKSK